MLKQVDRVFMHIVAQALARLPHIRFEGATYEPGAEFVSVWLYFPNEFVEADFHHEYRNALYRSTRTEIYGQETQFYG